MSEPTYAEFLKNADLMSKSLAANATELWHMDSSRGRLDTILTEAKGLIAQQASLTASKQVASKRLAELIDEGRKLLTFLRTGVKLHYGNKAEKLPEFGLQPFRGRPRPTLVGPDGRPVQSKPVQEDSPAEPQKP
jgi:hypothetical protein